MGPEFLLYDAEGKALDVLAHVVEAGGLFLIPTLDQPEDDLLEEGEDATTYLQEWLCEVG